MDFQKATFAIYNKENFKGTGFRLNNLSIIFTAKHVVKECKEVFVRSMGCKGSNIRLFSDFIYGHPTADIAAIFVDVGKWEDTESFPLHYRNGLPSLGTEIFAYGYNRYNRYNRVVNDSIQDRFHKGIIQRTYFEDWYQEKFWAFECSFSCIDGNSGSPIFLNNERKEVIGMEYRDIHDTRNKYTVLTGGVYLPSVSDWIDEMGLKEPDLLEIQKNRKDYLERFKEG